MTSTTRCAEVRRELNRLKWALVDALDDGATLEQLAAEMGKPWTAELLAQAFPDVVRRSEAA